MSSNDNPGAPFETVPADEAGEINETAALTAGLQHIRAATNENQKGLLLRGVHPKSHGCVNAVFVVNDDIDENYRVGLFAHPGKSYEAWIRFSNASVLREHDLKDGKNGSRGMAIKVMGVTGDMLSKDNGQSNQDFLMINTPEFAFANVRDYLRLERILARDPLGADPSPYFAPAILLGQGKPELFNSLSPDEQRGTLASAGVLPKILGETVHNPMQVQYFGAAPFLFGAGRAMKFSATPCADTEQEPFDPSTITADDPSKDYLREALSQTMKGDQDVHFDFKIQVRCVDTNDLNIEDATTTWPDERANYVNVARITIKVPQSPHESEEREHCEKLAFSPWHSLADHQPLGGINRLRREVYSASAKHRGTCGY